MRFGSAGTDKGRRFEPASGHSICDARRMTWHTETKAADSWTHSNRAAERPSGSYSVWSSSARACASAPSYAAGSWRAHNRRNESSRDTAKEGTILVLTRKVGEVIDVYDAEKCDDGTPRRPDDPLASIRVKEIRRNQVRIGVEADESDLIIHRRKIAREAADGGEASNGEGRDESTDEQCASCGKPLAGASYDGECEECWALSFE